MNSTLSQASAEFQSQGIRGALVGERQPKVPELTERTQSLRQAIERAEDNLDSLIQRLEPTVLAGGAFTTDVKQAVSGAENRPQIEPAPPYTTGAGEQLWLMECRVRRLIERMEVTQKRLEV